MQTDISLLMVNRIPEMVMLLKHCEPGRKLVATDDRICDLKMRNCKAAGSYQEVLSSKASLLT